MLTKNIETMKSEIAAHIAEDRVLQGTYWENGKGCFIGCLTHSQLAHKEVTERFGIPVPLVAICEDTFEALSPSESVKFFEDVGNAIGSDGKDLTRVHWKFLAETLKALPETETYIQRVIDTVVEGLQALSEGLSFAHADDASASVDAYSQGCICADCAYHAAFAAADPENCKLLFYTSIAASKAAKAACDYDAEIKRQRDSIITLLKNA